MHQVVGNVLHTLQNTMPLMTMAEAQLMVDEAPTTAQFALCTTASTTLHVSPEEIVFGKTCC